MRDSRECVTHTQQLQLMRYNSMAIIIVMNIMIITITIIIICINDYLKDIVGFLNLDMKKHSDNVQDIDVVQDFNIFFRC